MLIKVCFGLLISAELTYKESIVHFFVHVKIFCTFFYTRLFFGERNGFVMLFERVSKLAKKRDKSLKQVAEELDLSRNAIYQWKTSSPKAETLDKLANYFNTTTDYLLGRTDDPEPLETGNDNMPPEFFAIQRKSKKLSQKDQRTLLRIMEATFEEIDNGTFEEEDDEDEL